MASDDSRETRWGEARPAQPGEGGRERPPVATLKGWAEPKVIVRFWIISFMLALIALATLKVR